MKDRLKELAAHDPELLESGLGLITCGWGAAVLTNPDFFTTSAYRLASLLASQYTWAVLALVLGAIQIAAVVMAARRLRIGVAVLSAIGWIVLSISVAQRGDVPGLPPGATVYFLIGVLHTLLAVRLWRIP